MGARHGTSRAVRASGTPRTLGTRPYGPQPAQAPGGGPARDARRSQAWTGPGRLGPRQAPTPPICARNSLRDRKRPSSAAWRPRVVSSAWAAQSRPGAPCAAPPRSSRGCGMGRLVCAVSGRQDARAAAFGPFPIFAAPSRTGAIQSLSFYNFVGNFITTFSQSFSAIFLFYNNNFWKFSPIFRAFTPRVPYCAVGNAYGNQRKQEHLQSRPWR